MTAKEVLIEARKKIESPENWQKGSYGGKGKPMCATQAVLEAQGGNSFDIDIVGVQAYTALKNVMMHLVCEFNDSHTHSEVLAKFDEAIQSIEH